MEIVCLVGVCGTMARISMVYPPVHVAQVPVSSFMIMHEELLSDCERTVSCQERCTYKRPLLLVYDFLLLQPIPIYSDVFNIVIAPYFVL